METFIKSNEINNENLEQDLLQDENFNEKITGPGEPIIRIQGCGHQLEISNTLEKVIMLSEINEVLDGEVIELLIK